MENDMRRWIRLVETGWSSDGGAEIRATVVRNMEDEYRLPNLAPEELPHGFKRRNMVTIYRGVPHGVEEIRPGDWVALSRNYAAQHGETVISKRVPADHVASAGSDENEYYYVPRKQPEKTIRRKDSGGGWLKASDA